ncbi:hypothetical protein, partial [Bifidobacterium pullorum]|uniref:hypothetical protein n=1 Tax=Bifidobacterium pullorum TaxID=78448 RepID=UPI0019586314
MIKTTRITNKTIVNVFTGKPPHYVIIAQYILTLFRGLRNVFLGEIWPFAGKDNEKSINLL